jgi:hypothetical protein
MSDVSEARFWLCLGCHIHRRDEYDKRERWRGATPLSITNQWVTGRGEKNDERQSQQEIAARV